MKVLLNSYHHIHHHGLNGVLPAPRTTNPNSQLQPALVVVDDVVRVNHIENVVEQISVVGKTTICRHADISTVDETKKTDEDKLTPGSLVPKNRSSTHPDISSDKQIETNPRAESIQGLETCKFDKLTHIEKKSVRLFVIVNRLHKLSLTRNC